MAGRRTTTKDVALLHQLYQDGQLELAAEWQRNSVWPRPAKAYLIDTILAERPIPQLFLQRHTSAQTSRMAYTVIDGQQRLRAVFEFLDGRFRLAQSSGDLRNKKFDALPEARREQILNYDFVVEELSGYSDRDIRDLFVRMNKYVVRLSPQELRHAREEGAFYDFVERLGAMDFWREHRVFTPLQIRRMRPVEFAADASVLLVEGPQDKKSAIDLYYGGFQTSFPYANDVERRLNGYLEWILEALPDLSEHRFRKPVDLYSLLGALDEVATNGRVRIDAEEAGERLRRFERQIARTRRPAPANRYLIAASRQTDNIRPRLTRISTLQDVIRGD